jgi:hypothetical protein
MGVAIGARAAGGRLRATLGEHAASPSIDPSAAERADSGAVHTDRCPEIDCIRTVLAADGAALRAYLAKNELKCPTPSVYRRLSGPNQPR